MAGILRSLAGRLQHRDRRSAGGCRHRSRGQLGEPSSAAARRALAAGVALRPRLVARFLWQSALAGADVARRALAPGHAAATGLPALSAAPRARPGAERLLRLLEPAAGDAGGRLGARWRALASTASMSARTCRRRCGPKRRPSARPRASAMADLLLAAACFVLIMVALGLVRILRGPTRRRPHHGGAAARHRRDRDPAADRCFDRHGRRDRRRPGAGAARGLRLGRFRLRRARTRTTPARRAADDPRSTSSRCSRSRRVPSSFSPAPSACCASPTR